MLPSSLRFSAIKFLSVCVLMTFSVAVLAQVPAVPAAAVAVPPAAQGAPRPFRDVIKDAEEIPGFFTLYQKDEKVWIAINPEQFDKPFFLHTTFRKVSASADSIRARWAVQNWPCFAKSAGRCN